MYAAASFRCKNGLDTVQAGCPRGNLRLNLYSTFSVVSSFESVYQVLHTCELVVDVSH